MTPASSATTLGRLSRTRTEVIRAAVKTKLTRSPGLRFSSRKAIVVIVTNMASPTPSRTTRVRVGLKVTGRAGGAGWAADSAMVLVMPSSDGVRVG